MDTGSSKNLIQAAKFDALVDRPELFLKPLVMVVGNGENLKIRGWCRLRFAVVDKIVYHEVGVVEKLPCDFVLGAEFMAPHEVQLTYVGEGKTAMRIRKPWCLHCEQNKEHIQQEPQMKYSVKTAKLLKRDSRGDRFFPSCKVVVG